MATTLKLSDSINFAQAFGGWRGLALGNASEPAITCANIILQTLVAAPFTWNWNRASVTFLTSGGTQDYTPASSTFGVIEKASYVLAANITNTALTNNVATYTAVNSFIVGTNVSVTGSTNSTVFNVVNKPIVSATPTSFTINITNANIASAADTAVAVLTTNSVPGSLTEISNVINVLGSGNELGTPSFIAPQVDDNSGNITFRILPIPDQVYQITIVFQKRIPQLINSLSSTWAPIPDHYSFIYQYGFLALICAYFSDSRYMQFINKFVAGVLGAAEGLSENQKNVFSRAWYNSVTEQQFTNLRTAQGVEGLGKA
jgi:hypothetical protein